MEIINLDMTPSTVTPNAHAGQHDASRTVRFMLKNDGVPFTLAGTETITAEITRSDNTEVTVNVANTSSNYVDVVFDDTVCTVKGLYACELRLKDSDGFDIGSKNFALLVQRDPYDGAGVHVETVGPADICTFETSLPEPLQSVLVDVEATGGNGTPDNPISVNGYSEAKITRLGVNLWDEEWELGTYGNDGQPAPSSLVIRNKNFFKVPANGSIYIATPTNGIIFWYDASKAFISKEDFYTAGVKSVPNNAVWANFRMAGGYGTVYNNDISFNLPDTNTSYVAFNGQTYTVNFGQTVYGGVLDVTRGKLHVTHARFVLDNTTAPNQIGVSVLTNFTQVSYLPYIVVGKGNERFLSNRFTHQVEIEGGIWNNNSTTSVRMFLGLPTSVTNSAEAIAWFTNNPTEIVYELATPFDIDLTPEVISAIVGTNNVFADCGQSTVKYLKAGG